MSNDRSREQLINRYFILTWIISFLIMYGQNALNGALSVYFGQLGFSPAFTGVTALVFSVIALLFRFVSGSIADGKSRRLAIIMGCMIFAVSLFAVGLASAPVLLIIFRGMNGAGYAMGNTAVTTANYDVTPERSRSKGVGIFWAAQAFGYGLAGLSINYFARFESFRPLVLFLGVILTLALLLTLLCNYEKKPGFFKAGKSEAVSGASRYFEKKAVPAALIMLAFALSISSLTLYSSLYGAEHEIPNYGCFMFVAAITMTIGNLVVLPLTDRIGLFKGALPAIGAFSASLIWLANSPGALSFFVTAACCGFLQGCMYPILNICAVRGLPFERRGAGACTMFVALDIGMGIGSYLWGAVIEAVSYPIVFMFAAVLSMVTALLMFVFFGRIKKVSC